MSFSDIFKSSFLNGYTSVDITTPVVLVALGVNAMIGLYIFLIYRLVTKKSFYNKNFNISLWVLSVVTAGIIMTIQSNVVLSLGMVGALSIVRFRTAIKDPMDLVFLFWSISEGIICGAGLANIGIILAVVVTVGIFILNHLPLAQAPKIMVINSANIDVEADIQSVLKQCCSFSKVKSRNLSAGQLNLVIEYSSKKEIECIKKLSEIDNVISVSSLTHDGEVTF